MTAEVDILVPVLWRAGSAGPFMASMAASGAMDRVRVVVIAQAGDVGAWRSWLSHEVKVLTVPDEVIAFSAKVNVAYALTSEDDPAPWVMLAGDDIEWRPGWLDAAMGCAADGGWCVVGTNDGGLQARGEMTPHPLIWRHYVDTVGASWDGPGCVCHEGYRHNYVDREIVEAAQSRGVYRFCQESFVRHLHHGAGLAEVDSTYELGTRFLQEDKALWQIRAAEHGRR